jgi:hypothetical protein
MAALVGDLALCFSISAAWDQALAFYWICVETVVYVPGRGKTFLRRYLRIQYIS